MAEMRAWMEFLQAALEGLAAQASEPEATIASDVAGILEE
jgi:hypothetical protein